MARPLSVARAIPRNRNIEAALLLFALGINAYELAQIQLSVLEKLTSELWFCWLPLAVASLILHFVLRLKAREADALILPMAVLLNGLGIAMIYRLDLAKIANGATDLFATKQVIWTVLAVAAATAVILYIPNHLFLRKYVFVSGVVGMVLLVVPVFFPEINGARIWISVAGFTFQPGEIAKIALTIFFAGYLAQRRDSLSVVGRKIFGIQLPRARELGPILVFWVASLLVLVIQHDLGTSLLYFGLFLVMIYTATGRAIYVAVGLGMFVTGALLAGRAMQYVSGRIDSWLNPFDQAHYDAVGGSYQLVQGIFGLAHGGLTGTGLGGGVPNLVPLAESDFIISSIGEELGLFGIFAVLAVYLLIIARGVRVAINHTDDFSRLLSVGLSFVIALQCFIVIGGVTRVVPLTGLTTPLLAAGGSSLLANWIIIGLLLRISDSARKEAVE